VLPSLTEEGRTYDLARLKGQVVYVDFWASWCGPCRVSFPIIDEIYQELAGRGFLVLAINVDEYPEDAMEFLEALPVSYPVVRDAEGETPAAFGIIGMPTGFLIDQQGTVVKIHQGFRKSDADWLRKEILKLLES
jgi:thiol-disulfide isomerase/thioredoxin